MTTDSKNEEYTLSKSILTDGEPVRSLAYHFISAGLQKENSFIISGTEGGIISTTDLKSFETKIHLETTKHGHHITALVDIPNNNGQDCGGYVTGCKDSIVRIFDAEHKLVKTLNGHEKAVTSLSWLNLTPNTTKSNPFLISGSWDGTAKLWDLSSGSCVATLEGHENTVNVLGLPPQSILPDNEDCLVGRLVTGSAGIAHGNIIRDHKIRIWEVTFSKTTVVRTKVNKIIANDHNGPIRGLTFDSLTAMIISCSNDGSVKIRDGSSGECIITLETAPMDTVSQPPMLLDVVSLDAGKIAACSEDGNAFVWNVSGGHTDKVQIIPHPSCVWAVFALPNGDLVTACHDGYIRIFTLDSSRNAPAQDISALHDAVTETRSKASIGPSTEEIAQLPKWDEKGYNVGRSDGQVQVFNKSGKAIAAQWSTVSQTWIEVGEVTGRNVNTGSIDGVRYDHIFPIEVDVPGGGVQSLQIGYNNGENPFTTAQSFIDEHTLDQGYLSQIADYIRQRVGKDSVPTLGAVTDVEMTSSNSDSGRATTGAVGVGYTPTTSGLSTPSYKYFPIVGYKCFDVGADSKTLSKVMGKIREFNSVLNNSLSSYELEVLDRLCLTVSATSRYHATSISDAELKVVRKLLTEWSLSHVFPALDLARLVVMHPDASKDTRQVYWDEVVEVVLGKCKALEESNIEGPPSIAIPMMSLRLFVNCFRGGNGSLASVTSHLSKVLKCVESFALFSNKNVRLAVSTVLLNTASFLNSTAGKFQDLSPDLILSSVINILSSNIYETEAMLRVLVALGTTLLVSGKFIKCSKDLSVVSMVQHVSGKYGQKASDVVSELEMILQ